MMFDINHCANATRRLAKTDRGFLFLIGISAIQTRFVKTREY